MAKRLATLQTTQPTYLTVESQQNPQTPEDKRDVRRFVAVLYTLVGIATCFAAALSCISDPAKKIRLYSVHPKDIAGRLDTITHTSGQFSSPDLPREWRIGFSGTCAVYSGHSRCTYAFCPLLDLPKLVSGSVDQNISSHWQSAIATHKPHGAATREKHMMRAAGAFLIFSLLIGFGTVVVQVLTAHNQKLYWMIATPVMIIDAAFILGAQLLQRESSRSAVAWLQRSSSRSDLRMSGPGTSLLWASLAFKILSVPAVTWVVGKVLKALVKCLGCLEKYETKRKAKQDQRRRDQGIRDEDRTWGAETYPPG